MTRRERTGASLAVWLGLALWLVCGCIQREVAPPTPDELPILPVEIASESGARAYIGALADEADRAAGNAKDFQDWQPWFDSWSRGNGTARQNVFKPYENSLNARIGGTYDAKTKQWTFPAYDASKASAAASEASKGYRKVVP